MAKLGHVIFHPRLAAIRYEMDKPFGIGRGNDLGENNAVLLNRAAGHTGAGRNRHISEALR